MNAVQAVPNVSANNEMARPKIMNLAALDICLELPSGSESLSQLDITKANQGLAPSGICQTLKRKLKVMLTPGPMSSTMMTPHEESTTSNLALLRE